LGDTVLAPADVRLVLFEGVRASGDSATKRAAWISAHTAQWQAGWSF
jgi:hypothetical protein